MTRSSHLSLLAGFALLAAGAAPLAAQVSGNFLITVTEGGQARLVPNGQLNQFRSALGQSSRLTISVTYNGVNSGEFGFANLIGSADFRFAVPPPVPASVQPGQRLNFEIEFTPSSTQSSLSQFAVTARELPPPDSNLQPGQFGLIFQGLLGAVPDVRLAYALRTNGNVTPVASGGTLPFQDVTTNTQEFASFFLLNQGLAFSDVESIRLEGDSAFQLLQLPFLPTQLNANSSLGFQIRYWPRESGTHTAKLTVTADGVTSEINISGASRGPAWSYELIPSSGDQPSTFFEPDSTVVLPETDLNRRLTVFVRVTNTGNFDGDIAGINVAGQGFALLDPPFTPLVLKPGRSVTFGIVFTPPQAGRTTGRLRIGSDFFNLAATALGPQIEYSYTSGGANLAVNPGGNIVLPSTAVSQTTFAIFSLENTGNRAATIPSISLSGGGTSFTLLDLPPLPFVLEPGQKASFRIQFRPTQPGLNSDVLGVGTAFFNLASTAAALPPLPSYRFEGPSGTVQPLQQPAIGLTLAEPYPVALRGTIFLTVDSTSFGFDPAVQFSTGGQTVNFIIPANTTQAIFPTNSKTIRIQTGSAAGTIVLTPAFATDTGINRTPPVPESLVLTVPELAPQLIDMRMDVVAGGVQFVITGYSTPRNLTKIELTLEIDKREPAKYTFDVTAASNLWFNTGTSQGAGGLFSAVIPFRITGSANDVTKLLEEMNSATAVVSNRVGASQPITVKLK